MTLMVVFTCAAYKMAVGGRMPVVAYLTFLDKYMLLQSLYVILIAAQSRLASLVVDVISIHAVGTYDSISAAIFAGIWLLMQVWAIGTAWHLHQLAKPREESLNGNPEFLALWKEGEQQLKTMRREQLHEKSMRKRSQTNRVAPRQKSPAAVSSR